MTKVKCVLNPEIMRNDSIILSGLSECHKEMLQAGVPVAFYSVQQRVLGAAVTAQAQSGTLHA